MRFRDVIRVFFDRDDERIGANFPGMLDLAVTTFQEVNVALWSGAISEDLRKDVYARDIRINQLERSIRKEILTRLALGDTRDVAICFVLLNVVKDTERIGDYVKNLLDPIIDLRPVPEGALKTNVGNMGRDIGKILERVRPVFQQNDEAEAEVLVRRGRELAARCEGLVREISTAELPSGPTTGLVLVARFYKRISAHATNILSAVVMPVHKIDFFDEEALDRF